MNDHLETAKNDLFQINSNLPRKEEEEENLRSELRQLDHKISKWSYVAQLQLLKVLFNKGTCQFLEKFK